MSGFDLLNEVQWSADISPFSKALAGGLDVNEVNEAGESLLQLACLYRMKTCIELLVRSGANINHYSDEMGTPLNISISSGMDDMVDLMIEHGASIDLADAYGIAPIMEAVRSGYLNMVSKLIEKNAQINVRDSMGRSLFHWAILRNVDSVIFQKLVDVGVCADVVDKFGNTPLELAEKMGCNYCLPFLSK